MSFWSFPQIKKGRRQSRGAMLIIPSMFFGFVLLELIHADQIMLEFAKWLIPLFGHEIPPLFLRVLRAFAVSNSLRCIPYSASGRAIIPSCASQRQFPARLAAAACAVALPRAVLVLRPVWRGGGG